MSDRPTDPYRRRNWPDWSGVGVAVTLGLAVLALAGSFVTVREASTHASRGLADHEARIKSLETDRRLDEVISQLRVQIAILEGEVKTLREVVSAFKVEAKRR